MELHPIKFQPLYKYRLWGGNKLKTVLNKDYNEDNIGESWEVSDVKGDETKVINGALKGHTLRDLIKTFKGDFVGHSVYKKFGNEFPLLIKYIDAKTPLSVQVHPSDAIAKERHDSFGKNEMWYIMQADDNAEIIVGFDKELNEDEYKKRIKENTILEVMHHEKTNKGDTFYIPTGRVHAIGAGVLLAEIQQTSDVTYRMYDYDRVDASTGEKRELHNDLAVNVIDYKVCNSYHTEYKTTKNVSNKLVHSPYFKTNFLPIEGTITKDYSALDSFVIYMCVDGKGAEILVDSETYILNYGETIIIPATVNTVELTSSSTKILEVSL